MKSVLLFTALLLLLFTGHPERSVAQTSSRLLPASTVVPHYLLAIAYNTTTVLVFPSAVKPVDRGDRDVIAQKQPGVDNVLKVKAARRDFVPTNLHVFTADGRIYAFDLIYTDSLASTHDLARLDAAGDTSDAAPQVILTDQPVTTSELDRYVREMNSTRHTKRGPSDRVGRITLHLERVGLAGSLVFFRLQLANASNLDYHLDFIRLFIRDREKAKRTSVQDREMLPVYEDSLPVVPGRHAVTHIIAIPSFTLSGGKQFVLEAYEKNGGRTLTLHVRNNTLFNARSL